MLLQARLHFTSLVAAAVAYSAQEVRLAAVQHCMTCMADQILSYVATDRAFLYFSQQADRGEHGLQVAQTHVPGCLPL